MEQRISLITLGVENVARARAFYEALGWTSNSPTDEIAFFQAGGMVFALWDRDELARDSGVSASAGTSNVTLAHNVASPREVDRVLEEAAVAGASIKRFGAPTSWGGYSGVFCDLDGHPWEVAHNPGWPIGPDGSVSLG